MTVQVFHPLTLFSLHPGLDLTQLTLACKQLLSFLIDLSLHLDFNLSKLLLFTTELFFLQTN